MTIKTMIGLFPDMEHAAEAIQGLEELGLTGDEMLLVTEEESKQLSDMIVTEPENKARQGAAAGGLSGTALGLLGGASLVTLTGFGVLVAGGLIGAASGLTVGSYLGAIYGSRAASQVEYDLKEELAAGGVVLLIAAGGDDAGQVFGDVPGDKIRAVFEDHGASKIDIIVIDEQQLNAAREE